ncbi:hypothetical protein [uncultured Thomasclavelia sp.]|uniref:hypothetical protein n=1 Tax=uncultured Thomasclavelia sp. TaxID=3025759 RepID=UPI0025D3F2DD|nr:hypothetical protein [uncultured Thomasclavelia sp.]
MSVLLIRYLDKFVDNYLTKDDETVEEAKERLAQEQKDREAKAETEKLERQKKHEELINKHRVK